MQENEKCICDGVICIYKEECVGCGTAAIGCVEGIRSVDKQGRITIIYAEKHPAYFRPLISYYLEDKTTEEKMKYRDINDGNVKIMAPMPNAYLQGFTAGVNTASGEIAFDDAIPMHSIGFFGYHLMTAGLKSGKRLLKRIKRLLNDFILTAIDLWVLLCSERLKMPASRQTLFEIAFRSIGRPWKA